ncbi:hypothetical protein VUR80DRAFT_5245 [Thermomyces stellatus]
MASVFPKLLVGRGQATAIRAISTLNVALLFSRRQALRCDERPRSVNTSYAMKHLLVSPRTINQFATGSLAGLCAGVVLRILSPVIAVISGLVGLILLVASRYGITSWPVFRGVVRASRIGHWDGAGEKFVFKVTFVTTLMLAAFAHF